MITISSYTLQPLFLRFLTLWRRVQLVSDCITAVIWTLCCQWCCDSRMPLSSSSSVGTKPSFEGYKFVDLPSGRCCGESLRLNHLAVDVTPHTKATPETEANCKEYWRLLKSEEQLNEVVVQPNHQLCSFKIPSPRVTRNETSFEERNDYPAVHILRKMGDSGDLSIAFTNSCYRSEP